MKKHRAHLVWVIVGLAAIGCATNDIKRADNDIDDLVKKQITNHPENWKWADMKGQATGPLKALTTESEWDEYVRKSLTMGKLTNATVQAGRTALIHDHDQGWLLEAKRTIRFEYEQSVLTATITWTQTDGTWSYSDVDVVSLHPIKQIHPANPHDLESELSHWLSCSTVTLRRGIDKVHRLIAILLEQERRADAISLLRRVIVVDTSDLNSQTLLAELLMEEGQTDESLQIASSVFEWVESPALISRLLVLNPDLNIVTNDLFNVRQASLEGPRIVLIPIGEPPTPVLREFGSRLNQLLEIPVIFKSSDLTLGQPERNRGSKWLDQYFQQLFSRMSDTQKVALGLDIDFLSADQITDDQKVEAIESLMRKSGRETEIVAFRNALHRSMRANQYDAQRLLSEIQQVYTAAPGELVIFVSSGDLFEQTYNFIFATIYAPYAIMSYARYTGAFWNKPERRPRMLERMLKTGVWSAFRTASHGHCTTPYCMRVYVHALEEEDNINAELCQTCVERWKAYVASASPP